MQFASFFQGAYSSAAGVWGKLGQFLYERMWQMIEELITVDFAQSAAVQAFLAPSTFYRIMYMVKQFFGGFISPTEWIELVYYLGKGFTYLQFSAISLAFTWNWLDNFLFIPLADETTMGLFNWYKAIIQTGSGFTETKAAW
jgi:hypothetical protein